MGYAKGQLIRKEFTWNYAVDGGAVSTITLGADDFGGDTLPEGFVVTKVGADVLTAVTSAGTPTVVLGNTGDPDGYMADIWAEIQAVGAVRSGEVAGALIWDDTNDHEIDYYVNGTANNQNLILTIGTAALTAGKIRFFVEGYRQKA